MTSYAGNRNCDRDFSPRTGMREGEALRLFWDDIQFGKDANAPYRLIHVRRTHDPVHKIFNTLKNGKSRHVNRSQELRANRSHDLRHSYATIQLYEYYAPIQYVSEPLGHSSIKVTVDTYGHPRQGTNIKLANWLDHPKSSTGLHATLAQLPWHAIGIAH